MDYELEQCGNGGAAKKNAEAASTKTLPSDDQSIAPARIDRTEIEQPAKAVEVEVLSPSKPKSLTAQLREAAKSLDDVQTRLDRMGELQQQLAENNLKIVAELAKKAGLIE